MSIYSDKLAHVQAVINCQYSIAQGAPEVVSTINLEFLFFRFRTVEHVICDFLKSSSREVKMLCE